MKLIWRETSRGRTDNYTVGTCLQWISDGFLSKYWCSGSTKHLRTQPGKRSHNSSNNSSISTLEDKVDVEEGGIVRPRDNFVNNSNVVNNDNVNKTMKVVKV